MSDVPQGGGGGGKHKGKPKGKKASTHIDMTPMVDLAFLLLTFFMLTTSFNKPKTMEIQLPDPVKNHENQRETNERNVMNLLLAANDKLYYYFGVGDHPQLIQTDYTPDGIQKVLMKQEYKDNKFFMVLVKAAPNSKYKNIVNIFDVMRITNTTNALVDITEQEKTRLAAF